MNDTAEPADGGRPMPEHDSRNPPTEVLLFDAGGVLIDLGDEPLPGVRVQELGAWLRSPIALAFEKGLTSADEFAAAWIDSIDLDCDAATLIEHFRRWPIGPYAGVPALLSRLVVDYRIAILTNTNELHWRASPTNSSSTATRSESSPRTSSAWPSRMRKSSIS